MKKHNRRKIWGCIIVLICVFFTYNYVDALEPIVDENCNLLEGKSKNKEYCVNENEAKIEKYNVSLEENNNEQAVISWYPDGDYKKVEFKVDSINGQSPQKPIIVKGNKKIPLGISVAQNITVKLSTKQDPDCGCVTITLNLKHNENGGVIESDFQDTFVDTEPSTSSAINCSNYGTKFNKNSFEYAFCHTKTKAIQTKHTYELKTLKSFKNYKGKVDNKLSCDTKTFSKTEYYLEKNRKYYYANGTNTITAGTYVYNYAPGNIDKGYAKCKVTCEEAVVVEYGPPIASKAGLCFEYKVKVTSRVTCDAENPTMYKQSSKYCTPTPLCSNSYGTFNQAGPNEEFNSCVEDCDGGKYTEKCSKKCYQQVYNQTKSGNKNMNSIELYNGEKISLLKTVTKAEKEACFERNKNHKDYHGGCYYVQNKKIRWAQENPEKWNGAPGRWYPMKGHKDYTPYDVDSEGIYRRDYGSSHCQDICWWSGCKGDKYLNPADAAKDAAANKKVYLEAKAKCKAAASCTEKTAEFSIKVDYKTKEKTETVTYPFTKLGDNGNTQKLKSKNNASVKNSPAAEKPPILAYAGCYEDTNASNFYQTEWSFPGTWISSKTGEIKFEEQSTTGWYKKKGKFCIPLNAQNVNVKWWNWYMKKFGSGNSYMKKSYTDECGTVIKNASYTDPTTWNIRAYAKNFGYYGWNFDIKCFYGLNNNPSSQKTPKPTCDTSSPLKYRVRAINNSDMFPAKDGTKTATNKTGRKPGFNWTKEATLIAEKNPDYATDPTVLIGEIQKLGDSIYNGDEYLDYKFRLTPETLRAIRKYNESRIKKENKKTKTYVGGYAEWDGEFRIKNGVITYNSTGFLHNKNIFKNATYGNIGCNNDGIGTSCNSFYLSK